MLLIYIVQNIYLNEGHNASFKMYIIMHSLKFHIDLR